MGGSVERPVDPSGKLRSTENAVVARVHPKAPAVPKWTKKATRSRIGKRISQGSFSAAT